MKKTICIILACFLLVMTPIKGYATSAPLVFGLGEEVILPFLLSLLGVQAVNQIDSYDDLVSYNNQVYDSLIESLSGLAGLETIQAWIIKAVQGTIETDSVIWQKLKELAISNYVVATSDVSVPADNVLSVPAFQYAYTNSFSYGNSGRAVVGSEDCFVCCVNASSSIFYGIVASSNPNAYYRISWGDGTYSEERSLQLSSTYYDKNVYYFMQGFARPSDVYINENVTASYAPQIAWLMVYGDYSPAVAGSGIYSDAFELALSSQQKEDIIDGTSVIQLYNPADEQNGLHFVPDPEEPNDIKIPFAVTADWWNFLKQFGNDTKEQVVQAYNALNGLSGNSIGSISDAYDRLGIASVLSSAQSAAEGIASLTDSNVYPNSLTVADTINNSIPSSLTPQTPDEGIDNESEQGLYKLPDLRDYFPFCIPFDLIDLLSCFVAEPETPSFVIALSNGEETVSGNMDLHIWDNIAGVIRTFELIGFTVGLILITRNIIRG